MCGAPRSRHLHSNFSVPENAKVPLATIAYVSGMLSFAIKEALGGQTPASQFETKA